MKEYLKTERGITLVSLVVTIIILIILAGVSINMIIGQNGIITIAKRAKENMELARIEEETQLNELYTQLGEDGTLGGLDYDAIAKLDEFKSAIADAITQKGVETSPNDSIEKMVENIGKLGEVGSGNGGSDVIVPDNSGASIPNVTNLAKKTYVTWALNDEGTEYVINDTQTAPPTDWYDYDNGKWANIKTSKNGLEAYWVWIPRYEYIVPTTSTSATKIEAKFIPVSQTEPNAGFTIHPAFTNTGNGGFGELDGIWVAKFEAVSSTPTATNGGGDVPNLNVQVIPNQPSWRYITTNNIFSVCKKMTNEGEVLEGSTVDSHMMKNTEWGAVAILSQSKYGVYNTESINGAKGNKEYQVWNNPSSSYITGSVGSTKDASSQASVEEYNSINGPKASTTGTVYGVYDMASGSSEYVAGCLNGQENSKFGVPVGESKYVDLYTKDSNYIIGDATNETKGWNGDSNILLGTYTPIFFRGRKLQNDYACRHFFFRKLYKWRRRLLTVLELFLCHK